MARYVQIKTEEGYKLVPAGERPPPRPRLYINGAKERESYRSPLDGSIITSERQERAHMEAHGVVRPNDFGDNEGKDYFDRVKAERAAYYDGKSEKHRGELRKTLLETVDRLEQGQKPAQILYDKGDL